jgi:murein tripeptide amidase MpaA
MPHISCAFDGGNIECLNAENPADIQLTIRKDNKSDFYQWFHFRLTGAQGQHVRMRILNAGGASYAKGFADYSMAASYDREVWFRIPTQFDGKELNVEISPELDSMYFAYFAPYSMERHADLIAWACDSPLVNYERLGATLDGQDMDLLKIGDLDPKKKNYWVIARQHPGETMAEWWMEGFLERLTDDHDPVAKALLAAANFYVVPNMNPDGSRRGHLRTNAAGANLNREWQSPSLETSPEVFHVLNKMRQVGVDFSLDVHGDEALPYNFIAGPEGVPSWSDFRQSQLDGYKDALARISPDFQTKVGYPATAPGKANLTICTNFIAETFGCLSMTLEMPFKDTKDTPDELYGWSPQRCQRLGAANLDALLGHLHFSA